MCSYLTYEWPRKTHIETWLARLRLGGTKTKRERERQISDNDFTQKVVAKTKILVKVAKVMTQRNLFVKSSSSSWNMEYSVCLLSNVKPPHNYRVELSCRVWYRATQKYPISMVGFISLLQWRKMDSDVAHLCGRFKLFALDTAETYMSIHFGYKICWGKYFPFYQVYWPKSGNRHLLIIPHMVASVQILWINIGKNLQSQGVFESLHIIVEYLVMVSSRNLKHKHKVQSP